MDTVELHKLAYGFFPPGQRSPSMVIFEYATDEEAGGQMAWNELKANGCDTEGTLIFLGYYAG